MKITELKKYFEDGYCPLPDKPNTLFPFLFVDVPPVELTNVDGTKTKPHQSIEAVYLEYRFKPDHNYVPASYGLEDWDKAPTIELEHNGKRLLIPRIACGDPLPLSLRVEMKWPFANGYFRFFMPIAAFQDVPRGKSVSTPFLFVYNKEHVKVPVPIEFHIAGGTETHVDFKGIRDWYDGPSLEIGNMKYPLVKAAPLYPDDVRRRIDLKDGVWMEFYCQDSDFESIKGLMQASIG